jgi:hypothetical protein
VEYVYALTTVRKNGWGTECWGLHSTLEKAIAEIQNNADSYSEAGWFQYAVIEKVLIDGRPWDKNPVWFQLIPLKKPTDKFYWDPEEKREIYLRCEYEAVMLKETPAFAKNVTGWGIG